MKETIAILSIVTITLIGCGGDKKQTEQASTAVESKKVIDVVIIQQQSEPDTLKGSLTAEATGKIGNTEIKIAYHSPSVRGRIIWGGLVPFDKVWVTGAHMATSIEFNHNVEIGGKTIAAGKYAFFTIPGKDGWTAIINTNWQQHLTDKYDEAQDVVRLKVKPEQEEKNQERLRYVIEAEGNNSGEIVMYWERVEISIPFKIKG
ncbi:MAG: DUF2911 domain-containing protein [Chryseolinea sp.]